MPSPGRQSIVPFLLVAGAATALVGWNSFRIVQTVRQAGAERSPQRVATGTKLDLPVAEIGHLLGDRSSPGARPPVVVRQTDLAIRAFQACGVRTRHGSAFKSLAASTPSVRDSLARADAALASACAMQGRLSRTLPAAGRSAAGVELESYLSQALTAIESAQAQLTATTPAPPPAAPWGRGALRDPLIGLAGGLICLLFSRRPTAVPVNSANTDSTGDQGLPATLEPATYQDTALNLLDDSGSFFFTEVFDRTPVPLVLLDGDGTIVRLNAKAEALAGRSTDELRRRIYWDALVPESSRETVRSQFPLPEEAGPVAETWSMPDGTERVVMWNRALFLEGDSGKAALVLLAGTGPGALKPAALLPPPETPGVEEAARELENELTLIGGHCELLLDGRPLGAEPDADLEHLREAVDRAIQAVRRLLGGLPGQDRRAASSDPDA